MSARDYADDERDCLERVRAAALAHQLALRLTRAVKVASPAAGAEVSASPPVGTAWELSGVRFTLTTSAAVANRRANLEIVDQDGTVVYHFDSTAVTGAGSAATSNWISGFTVTSTTTQIMNPIASPPAVVLPGWAIKSQTVLLDVADQFSGIVLAVREYSTAAIYGQSALLDLEFGAEDFAPLVPVTSRPIANGQPAVVAPIPR